MLSLPDGWALLDGDGDNPVRRPRDGLTVHSRENDVGDPASEAPRVGCWSGVAHQGKDPEVSSGSGAWFNVWLRPDNTTPGFTGTSKIVIEVATTATHGKPNYTPRTEEVSLSGVGREWAFDASGILAVRVKVVEGAVIGNMGFSSYPQRNS